MLLSKLYLCLLYLLGHAYNPVSLIHPYNPVSKSQTAPPGPTPALPKEMTVCTIQKAYDNAQKRNNNYKETQSETELKTINSYGPNEMHHYFGTTDNEATKENNQEVYEITTKSLATKYNLTPEQMGSKCFKSMLKGKDVQNCLARLNNITACNPSDRYRTCDGSCNNLKHPPWGMASSCFERLLPATYSDGVSAKRVSCTGRPLPLPSKISNEIHSHLDLPSYILTHLFMVFGQFLDHDISLAPLSTGPNNKQLKCCPPKKGDPPNCDPIIIDKDYGFYKSLGIDCLSNTRSAICPTCTMGPRQQINSRTSYCDLSQMYGLSLKIAKKLRNSDGSGTLKFQYVYPVKKEELPPSSSNPKGDNCSSQDPKYDCFETGDPRGNQHPALTCLHTMFLREHNRIARLLKKMNPTWDDERLYQESRRIVIAEYQMIVYNEFLLVALGPERVNWFNLTVSKQGCTKYDKTVTGTLVTEFSTCAYRFGHTLINSLFPYAGDYGGGDYLRHLFQWPFGLYKGTLDGIVYGMTQSPCQTYDRWVVPDVSHHLYQFRGNTSGLDLPALNVNRGRDHGLAGYTKLLEFCGGPKITKWEQLDEIFQTGQRQYFQRIYECVEDIDCFSGGLAETPYPGAVVGPTFACIIGIQFYHLKFGDRFYFEHCDQTGSFTPDQLQEIRKVSFAKVICANTNIKQLPLYVFLASGSGNPIVYCDQLRPIDLRPWKE